MENRLDIIRAKEAIINELRNLSPDTVGLGKRVAELRQRFYDCGSCGHDDNIRLMKAFNDNADYLFAEKNRMLAYNKTQKESLIRQAESLAYTSDYNSAKEQIKKLQAEWKSAPRASKQDEDVLWQRFRQACDKVFENAKRENQAKQSEAKFKKEAIVSQAESLAYSTDYKAAKEQIKKLQNEWKQAPRASKYDEDALWTRFRQACDKVYENARIDFEKRKQEQKTAKEKKERIISQAQSLVYSNDFRSASDEMSRLSDEFYAAGSAGADNERLKEQFKSIKSKFYAAKKAAADQRRREHINKLYEVLDRKKQSLSRLESAIRNKESQLSDIMSRPDPGYNNPHRYEIAARRNEKISNLNSQIRDMSCKRMEMINSIADIQSKINNTF